ncbi:MAG: tRNA (N(6)-L-threonylcarbamoyladenosine(37)-C(2))-methylthiotransferase MtaB [Planctomycetes bacterium]|nr:tRNA (N(6)-L-threonylcarbamoyladenosine(37)-C(2))-methylthiotransferase MtaB [Planctomycetota bacterium]
MPRFTVATVGCKVNQYESAAIAETLRQAGLTDAADGATVDLCVVHTCCVTGVAAGKSRRLIQRLARTYPQASLVVTGCYATDNAASLHQNTRVVAVLGHEEDIAAQLTLLAGKIMQERAAVASPPQRQAGAAPKYSINNDDSIDATSRQLTHPIKPFPAGQVKHFFAAGTEGLSTLRHFDGRSRAIVKVQDGCDAFCSYCIVPHLRSRVFSRPAEAVLDEVRHLVAGGHREIVLSGVCLGAYGRKTTRLDLWQVGGDDQLARLLDRVAEAALPGRVRLSSLHPADVTERLLAVMANLPNVCPHVHLPLQSGSDAVLRRMNRRYTARQYIEAVDRARRCLDDPAITTDVIVGFPGESEDDFAATVALASRVGFAKIHIFPFSSRTGTPAEKWDRPSTEVTKRRCAELSELGRKLADAYRNRFVGRTLDVLMESPSAGLSKRYVRVKVRPPINDRLGQITAVRITGPIPNGLVGQVLG